MPDDPNRSSPASSGEARGPPGGNTQRGGWYPWIVMLVVLVGSYLVVLNTTVLGVALPAIAEEFGPGSALEVDWVVTVYLLAVVAAQPLTAWVATRLGHKLTYLGCLTGFVVGAALCAVAPTLPTLLAARFVQGFLGGALMPLSMSMVLTVFPPHRRGLVVGLRGMAIMAGPAFGPPIGGLLVTQATWRWIFIGFVLIGLLALALGIRFLQDPVQREARPLDIEGWLLAFMGLGMIVLGARQAGVWGYDSPQVVALFAVGAVLITVLVRRAWNRPHPILEMRLMAIPTFSLSVALVWTVTIVQFAWMTFLPVELQVLRDLTAQDVGLILAPAAVGLAATFPLGGWIADRMGARMPMLVGFAITVATTWQLANLNPTTPLWWIAAVLTIQGLGNGFIRAPLNVAAINALPNRYITHAATLRSLNRQMASALGTAALAGVLIAQLGTLTPDPTTAEEVLHAQSAFNSLFLVAFVLMVLSLVASVFMPGKRRMSEYQQRRTDEFRSGTADQ